MMRAVATQVQSVETSPKSEQDCSGSRSVTPDESRERSRVDYQQDRRGQVSIIVFLPGKLTITISIFLT